MQRATLLHLRFPFSYYLLPVYLFTVSQADTIDATGAWISLVCLHLLLYPASNGYNSYFDKDEQSIGGLKVPPPVSKELYTISLAMDACALLIGLWVSWQFSLMMLVYGLLSKAYSHPSVRIKKYPLLSWLVAGSFQGAFTYGMVWVAIVPEGPTQLLTLPVIAPALLSTAMLMGSYPMTQIYQHEEDSRRGDRTLSLLLGIKGTFLFTFMVFGLVSAGFTFYFMNIRSWLEGVLFLIGLQPVLLFFIYWMRKVWKDTSYADFDHTMRLNALSAHGLNAAFFAMYLLRFL